MNLMQRMNKESADEFLTEFVSELEKLISVFGFNEEQASSIRKCATALLNFIQYVVESK